MSRLAQVLSEYTRNRNTGNQYEIFVAVFLLRRMGLTNEDLETDRVFMDKVIGHNTIKHDFMNLFLKMNTAESLVFDGNIVQAVHCVTQDDSVGTGDFMLDTASGLKSLSVCEGKPKRDGTVTKCLTNPSAARFGCTEEDMVKFSEIQRLAVEEYKTEMGLKYGDETTWPSRVPTTASKRACSQVAKMVETRFNQLGPVRQTEILQDLLCIKHGTSPCDYLVLVDKKKWTTIFYKIGAPVSEWSPSLVSKGIYLYIMNGEKQLGQTQVKFNNGVYHKGKTSSITTSWNSTFNLTNTFILTKLNVG